MKKVIIIFIMLFMAATAFSNDEYEQAIDESNKLLEKAGERIEELENKNKELKDENEELRVSLVEANQSLKESNETLEKAFDRISKDQEEIERLREHIRRLIDAGVEVKTYNWNVSLIAGYPYEVGFNVGYNLPWFPNIGALLGSSYGFEQDMPKIKLGLTINID